MDAWVGLLGAIAAAVIALMGQHLTRRSESLERETSLLLEQCARLVALADDYRNRVWEERHSLATDQVGRWDLIECLPAEARARLLCRSEAVLQALEDMRVAGVDLGKAWRFRNADEIALDQAWTAYTATIRRFTSVAADHLRHRARSR